MAGDARRGQTLVAQEAEIAAQLADGRLQVVGEAAAGDPAGEAVEVAAVGQERVGRHAALGLEVVAEGAQVVVQFGHEGVHRKRPGAALRRPAPGGRTGTADRGLGSRGGDGYSAMNSARCDLT
jgi:hypothetical protein